MLNIRRVPHLASQLGMKPREVHELANSVDDYCQHLLLIDPTRRNKERVVLDVRGPLRRAQSRILRHILFPKLRPSEHSFGGVRGRSIRMNAEKHRRSQFVYSCDVSNFYPSIHHTRVYMFLGQQGCSPDVARLLTRICTHDHVLSLGLITSPFLADQLLKPFDARIAHMVESRGIVYSRYVDDITLSAAFDLRTSGFPDLLKQILSQYGLVTNPKKDRYGRLSDPGIQITGVRINRGKLDIPRSYNDELIRTLKDHRNLSLGNQFDGPLHSSSQLWGKIQFVGWINHGRLRYLNCLYGSIDWTNAMREAMSRNLVICKKTLTPIESKASIRSACA